MEIIKLVVGDYAANCYIVFCKETKEGIIVDPGDESNRIIKSIEDNNLNIKYIVLTHGHGDHIGGVKELKKLLKVPVLIHEDEVDLLANADKNLSYRMSIGSVEINPDETLRDNSVIEFGKQRALVIHTPGHSPGGICIKINNQLITGDTLFKNSIGRTDLYSGDFDSIIKSIKSKILNLGDDIVILPGHGDLSTIGNEKIYNRFLR